MACCSGKHISRVLLIFSAIIIHFPGLYSQQEDSSIEKIPPQFQQKFSRIEKIPLKPQQKNYRIEKIPLKGELVNFSGQCFLQDSDGFVWFGSKEGLYRYSGNGFKIFRNDPYDPESLSNNYIRTLFEDRNGVIWVGTENGLNRFDKQTESFYYYQHRGDDSTSIGWGHIKVIMEDDKGALWIATKNGFCRYHRGKETFENFYIKRQDDSSHLQDYQIYAIYPDRKGYLWLNTDDGLYRFNIGTRSFQKFSDPFFTWSIFEDSSKRCWLICSTGLFLYDTEDYSIKPFLNDPGDPNRIHGKHIRAIKEDQSGNIWIRTMDGLYCYTQSLELKSYIRHEREYPNTYDNQDLTRDLLVDNTGSVWYYTPEGINQIILRNRNFNVYDYHERIAFWVNNIYVENKDLIWYGTLNGICSFDRKNDLFQLHIGSDWESGFQHSTNFMFMDRKGTLWICIWNKGLYSMKRSRDPTDHKGRILPGTFEALTIDGEDFYRINHLFEDRVGRLWTGFSDEGPLRFLDRENEQVVRIVDNPSAMDRLPGNVQVRHETGSGILWAAGESGAFKIIPPFTRVSETEMMPADVIRINNIPYVGTSYLDTTDIMWFGTGKYGLMKLAGHDLTTYTTDQGLAGNQVMSIIPDDKGNLWIGTENGLSKFDIQTGTFVNYFVRHGLPVNQFRPQSVTRGEDGELFFGTVRGMISFYPDSIHINQYIAPVKITDLEIQNQKVHPGENSVLKRSNTYTENIELKHSQGHLTFEFAILNYREPELNQYKYMLEGLDMDWIYSGRRNFAIYSNLKPGEYIFQVAGANNDGVWNEEGTSLDLLINPPPWLTFWAYIVYTVILAGIVLWIWRYQVNRSRLRTAVEIERIEKEKVEEIDQMRSRFFANISHEFRTPLTLLLGPIEEFKKNLPALSSKNRSLLQTMKRNARRLQQLINQLLEISKLETGTVKMQVSEGNLTEFIRTIVLSFLSLAESKQIGYDYDLPEFPGPVYFDRDKLEKILANLVSNAFKFTPKGGEIMINLKYIGSEKDDVSLFAEISVQDTGKGIYPEELNKVFNRFYQVSDSDTREQEGTGIGLALTKELMDLYRGDIRVESKIGEGSTFSVKLPVSKAYFNEDEIVASPSLAEEETVEEITDSGIPEETISTKAQSIVKDRDSPLILIVEDHIDLRKYISRNLANENRILEAENGKEGLDKAIERIPDLVITDLTMPEMDGLELCEKLKDDDRTSHIPVIMLTARADRESKLKGLKTGADDYLIKPFDAEELQVRTINLIEQRRKLKEIFLQELRIKPLDEALHFQGDRLLRKVLDILRKNMGNMDYNVDRLPGELNMSRSQMFKKIDALTGSGPGELLRIMRLKKAAEHILTGKQNITQIMYEVGFQSPSYFARSFREYFGVNPSGYKKSVVT